MKIFATPCSNIGGIMDEHTSALTPTRFSSTGLTVEDRKNLRKAQYKKGGPPNWRETYREVCLLITLR